MKDKLADIIESHKKELGPIQFKVSPLSFGGAAVSGEGGGYGFGHVSEKEAIDLIRYAYDIGINLFDSAPIYGYGLSEKRIGKALKDVREKIFLTSKSGVSWHKDSGRINMTNDPVITEAMLTQSLKDLGTEYIDLYFIHWPDKNVDIRKPMEVLARYKEKGVIRHIGLCNTNVEDLEKAREISKIEVVQSEYNLFNRDVEKEVLPYCEEKDIAFMSWGTLDKGILSGNYNIKRQYDDVDCRRKAPWFKKSDVEKKVELVEEAQKFLDDHELTFLHLAIAFNLNADPVKTVLAGPKRADQLNDLVLSIGAHKEVQKRFDKWDEVDRVLQKFYHDK
ncbi:MAG: aldo/keto reductase [Halobacteriovoraceae bacterium]|nr:aldo/keto reductase [Halobacteriovoraceae bacterium]